MRFERISSNVIASEKKKVKKDLLSIRIQKEANKTTKNGLSIQLTSNFQLTYLRGLFGAKIGQAIINLELRLIENPCSHRQVKGG